MTDAQEQQLLLSRIEENSGRKNSNDEQRNIDQSQLLLEIEEICSDVSGSHTKIDELWQRIVDWQNTWKGDYKKSSLNKTMTELEVLKARLLFLVMEKISSTIGKKLEENQLEVFRLIQQKQAALRPTRSAKYFKHPIDSLSFFLYGFARGATVGDFLHSFNVSAFIVLPVTLLCGLLFGLTGISFELRQIFQESGIRLWDAPIFYKAVNNEYGMLSLLSELIAERSLFLKKAREASDIEGKRKHWDVQFEEMLAYANLLNQFKKDLFSTEEKKYSTYLILVAAWEKSTTMKKKPWFRAYCYMMVLLYMLFTDYVFLKVGLMLCALVLGKDFTLLAFISALIAHPTPALVGVAVFLGVLVLIGAYSGIKAMQLKNSSNHAYLCEFMKIADGQSESQLQCLNRKINFYLDAVQWHANEVKKIYYSDSPNRLLINCSMASVASVSSSPETVSVI